MDIKEEKAAMKKYYLHILFKSSKRKKKERSEQLEKEKGGARGERVRAGRRRQGKWRNVR